ncbi:3-hydroxyisobutyryl-coa hydrolase, mitochondrial [Plakobranchus ocellatus]|uniref:3-hydroxyisobutyryl-CoA hydrolase, mitochondrial n=1 Tax=Plakobranchus ocellatus TaxID=259542 RepID=A0AAV4BPL9_9GAST|nr:3-hydroxyisobutyryl-coa hydrolase, mitochondrial [Plakobranchus ocellatus]
MSKFKFEHIGLRSRFRGSRVQSMSQPRPSSDDHGLLYRRQGKVQHVTLNRPKALNALSLEMVRDLTPRLKEWAHDPETAVVTLRGAGDKAFCAGGDLKNITFSAQAGGHYGKEYFFEEFQLDYMIGVYPKPLISICNGLTFGGAAGLSVIGRFCVATEKTVFSMPECFIGLFPDVGSGYYLSRLSDNLGVFLGLTGHRVKGRDLVRVGLASHYIDNSQIAELESALSNLPGVVSMEEVELLLDSFQAASSTNYPESFSLEPHRKQISHCFAGKSVEEILARLRQDGSSWALAQLDILSKMSPTALKISLRLLQHGCDMDLAQALQTEYRLTQRCVADRDFHEGIRAAILDKDHNPCWCPATLEEVTEERLEQYFSRFEDQEELILGDHLFY